MRNPTSTGNCGQPIILAEKCEDRSYALIDPNQRFTSAKKQDLLSVKKQNSVPIVPSSIKEECEEISQIINNKFMGKNCETANGSRDVSPTVEPFIPERV